MHTTSPRTPSYRLDKPSGRAVGGHDGRDFYLGRLRDPESWAEYDRLIAEWLADGRRLPTALSRPGSDLTVSELRVAYLRFADSYDVKNGEAHTAPPLPGVR